MKIFLTLETFRTGTAFRNEKIIVIGLTAVDGRQETHIWTEWDLGGEVEVVKSFYSFLKGALNEVETKNLKYFSGQSPALERIFIYGFNVTRFDIPLLVQKGVEHGIDDLPGLNLLFSNMVVTDYHQLLLAMNKMRHRGINWRNFSTWLTKLGSNVPRVETSGGDVREMYRRGDYSRIVERVNAKLVTLQEATRLLLSSRMKWVLDKRT